MARRTVQLLGGNVNNIGCRTIVVGGVADHVHLLFVMGRTMSISDAVKGIKVPSTGWVNQTRGRDSPFQWQAGYGAFSVSQSNVETVREYIERQPEHHATQSFQDEFRKLMRRHGIDWDERYVWD